MNKIKKIILIFLYLNKIHCIDNPHFYRASHFFGEARLKKNGLTTYDIWGSGGKTFKGFNCNGQKTNILNIYGDENIKELARNVPNNILDKQPNSIINNLWRLETSPCFGQVKFEGKFNTIEIAIDLYKNFINGFFGQLYIPFRKLQITDIRIKNLSVRKEVGPEVNFDGFNTYVRDLAKNLRAYGINLNQWFNDTGIGDTTLLLGYTLNYNETTYLDFIDLTLKTGLLLPTGKQTNPMNVFELPQGYNGHIAIPFYTQLSVGIFDWLTIGLYGGSLFFMDKRKCVTMRTAREQNGFIKLTQGTALVNKGALWSIGMFTKADHILAGFSFYFGYRFDKEERTKYSPYNTRVFKQEIVNGDQLLRGWQMNTINLIAEYDFATFHHPNPPRIYVFFDIPFDGKRIFKTNMSGGGIAIDYVW